MNSPFDYLRYDRGRLPMAYQFNVDNSTYAISAIPQNIVRPGTPTGSAVIGSTLTSPDTGAWGGTPTITFARQWFRADPTYSGEALVMANGDIVYTGATDIVGATNATYALTTTDANKVIGVKVTASNSLGTVTLASFVVNPIMDAATVALAVRFTTPPTNQRQSFINTLVNSLKLAGIWTKLDALYVMAAADSQAARLNWVSSSFTLSAISAPTFTADRGFTGDGASSYLDTGFDATAAPSPNFTLNSAHLGVYIETVRVGVSAVQMGVSSNSGSKEDAIYGYFSDGNFYPRINSIGGGVANSGSKGRLIASRTASSGTVAYRNGTSLGTVATVSDAIATGNVYIGAENFGAVAGNYSSDLLGSASIGGGLSATDAANLDAALLVYLLAVGAS